MFQNSRTSLTVRLKHLPQERISTFYLDRSFPSVIEGKDTWMQCNVRENTKEHGKDWMLCHLSLLFLDVRALLRSHCFCKIHLRTQLQSTTIALISRCPDLGWGRGNLTQLAYFSMTVTASRYCSTVEIFLWHKHLLCTDLHSILIIFHQLTFGGILNNQTVHQIGIILQFMVMFESETS